MKSFQGQLCDILLRIPEDDMKLLRVAALLLLFGAAYPADCQSIDKPTDKRPRKKSRRQDPWPKA
jgi:hypothetical protein